MFRNLFVAALLVIGAAPIVAAGADAPKKDAPAGADAPKKDAPAAASTEPEGVPLELKIVKETADPLEFHTDGFPNHVFEEKILQAAQKGTPLKGSVVELFMEIKNTGKEPITIWVSGDVTFLTLDLQGKGAKSVESKHAPLKDTIPPKAVTILPGKIHQMPLFRLDYGVRNEEKHAYMTKGGYYTLTATFKTGISPAPKGTTHFLPKGFGEVILKSAPFRFLAVKPS